MPALRKYRLSMFGFLPNLFIKDNMPEKNSPVNRGTYNASHYSNQSKKHSNSLKLDRFKPKLPENIFGVFRSERRIDPAIIASPFSLFEPRLIPILKPVPKQTASARMSGKSNEQEYEYELASVMVPTTPFSKKPSLF